MLLPVHMPLKLFHNRQRLRVNGWNAKRFVQFCVSLGNFFVVTGVWPPLFRTVQTVFLSLKQMSLTQSWKLVHEAIELRCEVCTMGIFSCFVIIRLCAVTFSRCRSNVTPNTYEPSLGNKRAEIRFESDSCHSVRQLRTFSFK